MAASADLPKKILIFGGTGLIGAYILDALVAAGESFEKLGIFTSPSTAEKKSDELEKLKARGVNVIVGDISNESDVKKAYEDYDTVISALGHPALISQIPLLTLAESSPSIKHFYPSEYGTDIEYFAHSASEKPHQLKLRVRAHIRACIHRLKITYLVTGPYPELYFSAQPAGKEKAGSFDVKRAKTTLLGTGEERVSFTTMPDVGTLLVAALKTPVEASPRALKVNSFTASPKEVLAEFGKQTGREWEVEYVPLEELRELEKKAWEEGDPFATVFTLRRIWTEGGTLYDVRDNGRIGEPDVGGLVEIVREEIARQEALGEGRL